mmetsp:Transcript_11754/g.16361  ORF Transcript_11754/g.16361 Transcript_11754/m.16361 type:complete len:344 (+) Transcript_11754:639-1670(+)
MTDQLKILAASCLCTLDFVIHAVGHDLAAVGEDAQVLAPRPQELEVAGEPRPLQHELGVAADGEDAAGLDAVVVVQHEHLGAGGQGALVNHGLAVVLAVVLQLRDLEQAVGGGEEADVADEGLHLGVGDRYGRVAHQPRVVEPRPGSSAVEVVPVERAREALPVQHRVRHQVGGHAAVRVHVAEVHLPPRLQQLPRPAQHRVLVRAEVDDAVGDDHVEAVRLQGQLRQPLDVPLVEGGVGPRVPEGLGVVLPVGTGHGQLLVGHVHAHHGPGLAHHVRDQVHVPPGPAPQVQHLTAFKLLGDHEPTTVVLGHDFIVDEAGGCADVPRHSVRCCACVGLEVITF